MSSSILQPMKCIGKSAVKQNIESFHHTDQLVMYGEHENKHVAVNGNQT
jgi:hypothetical protein